MLYMIDCEALLAMEMALYKSFWNRGVMAEVEI